MPEIRYECKLQHKGHRITLNVFTDGPISPQELKPLAIQECVEFLDYLGIKANAADIQPIGYKDKGIFN